MPGLIRKDPFREMMSLTDAIDRLWDEAIFRPRRWLLPRLWEEESLPLDVYQTEDAVVVRTSVPGVKPEEIAITVAGGNLSIRGQTKVEEEVKEENYIRRERRYGAFSREVALPAGLLTDKAEASFENGVLTITIPKAEEVKAKAIEVKVKK